MTDQATVATVGVDAGLRGRLRRALPAGLLDSGLSSLATFSMGLFATRYLPVPELGAYALFYAAFLLATVIPANLVFTPAEVLTNALPREHRPRVLGESLRIGLPVAALSAAVVCPAALLVPSEVALHVRVAFALTVTALSAISPVQDHVRRVLHQGGKSWGAATVSAVQLTTVVGVLGTCLASGASKQWVPYSALALANLASATVGFAIARDGIRFPTRVHFRELVQSGRWLAGGSTYAFAAGFAGVALVTTRASADAAGYAEAARVLSQPVAVIAVGIVAVFSPELMQAARTRASRHLLRLALAFAALVASGGALWALAVGVQWPASPLPRLFEAAYHESGLLALFIGYEVLNYVALGYGVALIGGRREQPSAVINVVAATVGVIGIGVLAGSSGAYAVVYGGLAGAAVKLVGYRWAVGKMLGSPAPPTSESA